MTTRDDFRRASWLLACAPFTAWASLSCALASSAPPSGDSTVIATVDPTVQQPEALDQSCADAIINDGRTPFVTSAFALTETRGDVWACPRPNSVQGTTVTVRPRDNEGFCLSGKLGDKGFTYLVFSLSTRNEAGTLIFHALDAFSLAIDALEFTLESPPPDGLAVELSSVARLSCPEDPSLCVDTGFSPFSSADGNAPLRLTGAGTHRLRLNQFLALRPVDPTQTLDTTRLADVRFRPLSDDFDFCVGGLRFLDVADMPIVPRQL